YPCNIGTLKSGFIVTIISTYSVQAAANTTVTNTATATSPVADPNSANNSAQATINVVAQPTNNCSLGAPLQTAPLAGSSVASPVTFSWTAVQGATGYVLLISGPAGLVAIPTSNTTATAPLPNGSYSWSVAATFQGGCPVTN